MKTWIQQPLAILLLWVPCITSSQENHAPGETESYYEQRAREDAEYEQQLALKEEEARDFWEDQENYEEQLKKRDRKAYRAYMKGKRDAYAEHYRHCNHHCGHGHYYYSHASFYYSGYHYQRPTPVMHTGIRAGLPDLRVGIGIF